MEGLLIVCVTFMVSLHLITGEPCKFNSDPCICKTSAFELNLKPLMDSRQGFDFSVTEKGGDYTYYIQPCNKPLTTQISACRSVSPDLIGCQLNKAGTPAFGLGVRNKYEATGSPDNGLYVLTNSFIDSTSISRILNLTLKCSDQETTFTYDGTSGSESPFTYSFTLLSRHICASGGTVESGGLSVGSVMVIIFFVLIIIYLVGGVLILKFVKKAEGKEVIPNYSFWTGFPLLVKDGVMFTFRCCSGNPAYSKI